MRWVLTLALIFACPPAWGSYRAYVLWVVHYRGNKPFRAERVESTLDPLQYEAFHGLRARARVYLLDTWYCPGDTSDRELCKSPTAKGQGGAKRGPASTAPKRGSLPLKYQPYIPR